MDYIFVGFAVTNAAFPIVSPVWGFVKLCFFIVSGSKVDEKDIK